MPGYTTMSKTFLRQWHNYEEHRRPGFHKSRYVGGSRVYELECGHTVRHKLSRPLVQRVKCYSCGQWGGSSGTRTSVEYDLENCTVKEEKWQPGPQLPKWIVTRHTEECMRGIYVDRKQCTCNSTDVKTIYPKRVDK